MLGFHEQERAVTAGHDHTCRVWKVPEESQLIFRSHATAVDCVRYITGTQWVSGASDGSLAVWSQMKKRPVSVVRGAHTPASDDVAPAGAGTVGGDAASWVQSVAVCHGSDLVVRRSAPPDMQHRGHQLCHHFLSLCACTFIVRGPMRMDWHAYSLLCRQRSRHEEGQQPRGPLCCAGKWSSGWAHSTVGCSRGTHRRPGVVSNWRPPCQRLCECPPHCSQRSLCTGWHGPRAPPWPLVP